MNVYIRKLFILGGISDLLCTHAQSLQLFTIPQTVTHKASLFMEFPRQEYWSGLPVPWPGDLLDSVIKPLSPALAGIFFTTEPPRKPKWLRVLVTKWKARIFKSSLNVSLKHNFLLTHAQMLHPNHISDVNLFKINGFILFHKTSILVFKMQKMFKTTLWINDNRTVQ